MTALRFALRQLRKTPGFTFIAVLTLALGIGANTAIFSVMYAVLLQPLPYPDGDRIVILTQSDPNQPQISVAYPDYVDWKRDNTVFENIAVSRRESYNLSGLEGRAPEQVSGALVTGNFFKVIGLQPQVGRVFTEEEDRVGGPMVSKKRSEEHTSELQSLAYLVCRLLLEKKKELFRCTAQRARPHVRGCV